MRLLENKITKSVLLFFVLIQLNANSQNIDSLKQVFRTTNQDTTRCNVLISLVEFEQNDSVTFEYMKTLKEIAEKNLANKSLVNKKIFLQHLAYSYNEFGSYYDSKGKLAVAKENYEKSLHILEKLDLKEAYGAILNNLGALCEKRGEITLASNYLERSFKVYESDLDTIGMAHSLNSLGFLYKNQGNVTKSLDYFFRSLKISEKSKDKKGIAISYNNIASIYQNQEDYNSALYYFKKSLKILIEINIKEYEAASLNNIGHLYIKKNEFDTALIYYNKSLKIQNEIGNQYGIATTLNNLGRLFEAKKNEDEALNYFQKSLAIFEQSEEKKPTASVLCSIANLLAKKGDYKNALKFANKGYEYAKELGFPEIVQSAAVTLTYIHKKLKNYEEAFKYYEIEVQMSDSLFNAETKKESVKKLMQYEYEKKELETKLIQDKKLAELTLQNEKAASRKNKIVFSLLFIALFLSASIFYLFKLFKQRSIINANKNKELKQKLLLSQMNPHFIFNSVDNIQSLIHSNKNKEAVNYLTKFSKLTRQILQNSNENYISFDEEITMLDNYLTIQKLLYNNKFTHTINIDDTIEAESILVPPMLTQPFIENAIKHGLKEKTNDGIITINFTMKNNALIFEVRDNGTGLELKENNNNHKSLATQIVKERLNSNSPKKDIEIVIENIIENNVIIGVRTQLEIPYIYNN